MRLYPVVASPINQKPEGPARVADMPEHHLYPFDPEARSHWIRLRTLVVLRWIAIAGQISAVTVAQYIFDMRIEAALCYMAIGAASRRDRCRES